MPTPSWSAWPSPSAAVDGQKAALRLPFQEVLRVYQVIPRGPRGRRKGAIRAALAFLAEGWALGIFPGVPTGRRILREAKSGVVVLALRSGARVLPVHVGRLPGPLSRLRGQRLDDLVGEPLHMDPAMRGGAAYRAAADEIMHTIYALPERHARESL